MDEQAGISRLYEMRGIAESMTRDGDPVLQEAIPRIVAILTDALRLVDLDYPREPDRRSAPDANGDIPLP